MLENIIELLDVKEHILFENHLLWDVSMIQVLKKNIVYKMLADFVNRCIHDV